MKKYTAAWFNSLFYAWLAAALFFDVSYFLLEMGKGDILDIIILLSENGYSFLFSLLGSLLFIYPFKTLTKKLIDALSKLAFASITSFYGLIIFVFAIELLSEFKFNVTSYLTNFEKLTIASAAVNGFVFGLLYYSYRKITA